MKLQKYPYKDAIATAFLFNARQRVKKRVRKRQDAQKLSNLMKKQTERKNQRVLNDL
jgi:hypothetical protein